MNGTLHVVGAGVTGLSAALAAARAGRRVRLYEAAGQAGGRCRAVGLGEDSHDNGTHVIVAGNRAVTALLRSIGALGRWIEPEPSGLPIVDLATGRAFHVGLSPLSWWHGDRRPPGLDPRGLVQLIRLTLPGPDRPVGDIVPKGRLYAAVIDPLATAVLNTAPACASSRRLGTVLRLLLRPGAARLLVARDGLGPDLVEPMIDELARHGVAPAYQTRLQAIEQDRGRAARLLFADRAIDLAADDRVVLALPPHAVARLMPTLPLPDRYEAIVNLHYLVTGVGLRFIGLLGGLVQWVLCRPGRISATISAAGEAARIDADDLAARGWREIARAAAVLGIDLPEAMPPARVVKERRATVSQPAGFRIHVDRRPLANLVLAGDWLADDLPATLEAAVRSGEAAAHA